MLNNVYQTYKPKIPKGYYLVKVPSVKYGYLYYVRYIRNGKLVPSRWNTRTKDKREAARFALNNRERILTAYDCRKEIKRGSMYHTLASFYAKDSQLLQEMQDRRKVFGERTRRQYHSFIVNSLIPFLKSSGVVTYADITPVLLDNFQTYLLDKNIKPQTINKRFGFARQMFDRLVQKGIVYDNVFSRIKPLCGDQKPRGCYEIDKVYGIFNRKWRDETSYILNLLIYSTGLRNSEISRIQKDDIISIKDCHFVNVKTSKTRNGIRLVPLHPFVYNKLINYLGRKEMSKDQRVYKKANVLLGQKLGLTEEELDKQYITFYSGRHYWKTLMDAYNLGEAEEYFMGHKVSSDVSKLYNHKDKQGSKMLLKRAKDVFNILDKSLLKV